MSGYVPNEMEAYAAGLERLVAFMGRKLGYDGRTVAELIRNCRLASAPNMGRRMVPPEDIVKEELNGGR